MEMKKVLKVVLIRSGILLSLLVVLIMAIKTMVQQGPIQEPKQKRVLAILSGEKFEEYEPHLKGIKDGMIFNGLDYIIKTYASPSLIHEADLVYIMDPCLAEIIITQKGLDLPCPVIGYSYITAIAAPLKNYTGIYSGLDLQKVFSIYQKIIPGMRKVGVIYTRGSCEGEKQVQALKDMAQMRPNLEITIQPLDYYGEDINRVLSELASQVDTIYAVSRDRIIDTHMESISKFCIQNRIPLIGGGIFGPPKGAVASLAFDPYRIGRKGADIIRALNEGRAASQIDIVKVEPELYLNLTSAYSLGLDIPSEIRKDAKKVYN
ncbi:hypothetical protein JXL19_02275 [bacterium]|nr:hypothetical protein [bacterium]